MKIQIIGAGGHSKVIIQTAHAAGFIVAKIFDDNEQLHGKNLLGVPIIGKITQSFESPIPTIIAIGDNSVRKQLADLITLPYITLIHPSAIIDPTVKLGDGTVVLAGAVIQVDTVIGHHVIINTSASIDHDCQVENFVHIAPGCNLCGNVKVGEGTLIGVGACARPNIRIGSWSVIGAGAVATSDITSKMTVVGIPAKNILEKHFAQRNDQSNLEKSTLNMGMNK
jgi:sugar O-acyltransferase (sialic acid O-acetyltransferase NeuD family)